MSISMFSSLSQPGRILSTDCPPQNSGNNHAIPSPANGKEASALQALVKKGVINEAFWLNPGYAKTKLSVLPENIRIKILNFLNVPLEFRVPNPAAPQNPIKIAASLKEIHEALVKICETYSIPYGRFEIIGGGVPWLLGDEYFQEILRELLQDPEAELTREQIEAIIRIPPDIDLRSWLSLLNGQENLPIDKLIDFFASKAYPAAISPEALRRAINEHIFTRIDTTLVQDKEGGITDYNLLNLAPENAIRTEWSLVKSLARESLFVVQDLQLPLLDLLKNEKTPIVPSGSFCGGLQAILDRIGRILHVRNPKNINKNGSFSFCSFLTQRYLCPEEHCQNTLCETTWNASRSAKDPVANLALLVKNWLKKHCKDDFFFRSPFLFNYSILMQDFISPEGLSRFWKLCAPLLEHKEASAIDSAAPFECLTIAMQTEGITFSLLSALVQVQGWIALASPWEQKGSLSYSLVEHDGKKQALQLVYKGVCLLLPFTPFRAIKTLEKEVSTLFDRNQKEALTVLDALAAKITPQFTHETEKFLTRPGRLSFFTNQLPSLQESAAALLNGKSILLKQLGFSVLLGIHTLQPEKHSLRILIENLPAILSFAKTGSEAAFLMLWMKHSLPFQQNLIDQLQDVLDTTHASDHSMLNNVIHNAWISALAKTQDTELVSCSIKLWKNNFSDGQNDQQIRSGKLLIKNTLPAQGDKALQVLNELLCRNLLTFEEEQGFFVFFTKHLSQIQHNAQRYSHARRLYAWANTLLLKETGGQTKAGFLWMVEELLSHGDVHEANGLAQAGAEKLFFDEKDADRFRSIFFDYEKRQLTLSNQAHVVLELNAPLHFQLKHHQQIPLLFMALRKQFDDNAFADCLCTLAKIVKLPPGLTIKQQEEAKKAAFALTSRLCETAASPVLLETLFTILELIDAELGMTGSEKQKILYLLEPKLDEWKNHPELFETAGSIFSLLSLWTLKNVNSLCLDRKTFFAKALPQWLPISSTTKQSRSIARNCACHLPALASLYEASKQLPALYQIIHKLVQLNSIEKEQHTLVLSLLKKCLQEKENPTPLTLIESIYTAICRDAQENKWHQDKEAKILPYLLVDNYLRSKELEKAIHWIHLCDGKFPGEQRQFQREIFSKRLAWADSLVVHQRYSEALDLFKLLAADEADSIPEIMQKILRIPSFELLKDAGFCLKILLASAEISHYQVKNNSPMQNLAQEVAVFAVENSEKVVITDFVKLIRFYHITDEKVWSYLLLAIRGSSDNKLKIGVWKMWQNVSLSAAFKAQPQASAIRCWIRGFRVFETLPEDIKKDCTEFLQKATPVLLEFFASDSIDMDQKSGLIIQLMPLVRREHKPLINGFLALMENEVGYNFLLFTMAFKEPGSFLKCGRYILRLMDKSHEPMSFIETEYILYKFIQNRSIVPEQNRIEWRQSVLQLLDKLQQSVAFESYPFLLVDALVETNDAILLGKAIEITLFSIRKQIPLPPLDEKETVSSVVIELLNCLMATNAIDNALEILTSPVFKNLFPDKFKGKIWGEIAVRYFSKAADPKEKAEKEALDFYFDKYTSIALCPEISDACIKAALKLMALNDLEEIYLPKFKGHFDSSVLEFNLFYQLAGQIICIDTPCAKANAKLLKYGTFVLQDLMAAHVCYDNHIVDLLDNFVLRAYTELAEEYEWMIPAAKVLIEQAYKQKILQKFPSYHIPFIYLMHLDHHETRQYDAELQKKSIQEFLCKMFSVFNTGKNLYYAIFLVNSAQNRVFFENDPGLLSIYKMIIKHFIKHHYVFIDDKPAWELIQLMLEGNTFLHSDPSGSARTAFAQIYLEWLSAMISVLELEIRNEDEKTMQWDISLFFLDIIAQVQTKNLTTGEYGNFLPLLLKFVSIMPQLLPDEQVDCESWLKTLKHITSEIYERIVYSPSTPKLPAVLKEKRAQTMTLWIMSLIKSQRFDAAVIACHHMEKAFKDTTGVYPGLRHFDLLQEIIEIFAQTLSPTHLHSQPKPYHILAAQIFALLKEADPSKKSMADYHNRRASLMTLWIKKLVQSKNADAFIMASKHFAEATAAAAHIYDGEQMSLKQELDHLFPKKL